MRQWIFSKNLLGVSMKRLIIILLLICAPIFGQNSLTDEQILQIQAKVEKIQKENEILSKLVTEYQKEVENDSLLLVKKDEQIKILQERSDLLEDQVKLTKPKWFENKYAWYGYGVFTVVGNIWLYDKVKN
jgi:hypothetical protein